MLIETFGVMVAAWMAVLTVRFLVDARRYAGVIADELRFHRRDRQELKRRFARVIGERAPFDW